MYYELLIIITYQNLNKHFSTINVNKWRVSQLQEISVFVCSALSMIFLGGGALREQNLSDVTRFLVRNEKSIVITNASFFCHDLPPPTSCDSMRLLLLAR